MLLASVALFVSLASSALGHGYVQQQTVGGVVYTGYLPYQDPYMSPTPARIIRKVPGNGPVTDLSLIDVQCNGWSEGGVIGSAPAALVASAAPGSTVTFNWTTWPDSHVGRTYSPLGSLSTSNIPFSDHHIHGKGSIRYHKVVAWNVVSAIHHL